MREQARRAGIPPATLTRLAQRFGLRGYDAVRKLYADAVRQRPESYRGRAEELLVRRDSEGDEALVQDIFASLTQHLQELSLPAAVDRFTAAADMIAERKPRLLSRPALELFRRLYFPLRALAVRRELRAGRWLRRHRRRRAAHHRRARRVAGDLGEALCAAHHRGGEIRQGSRRARHRGDRQRNLAARAPRRRGDAGAHRNAVLLSHHGAGFRRGRMPGRAGRRAPRQARRWPRSTKANGN